MLYAVRSAKMGGGVAATGLPRCDQRSALALLRLLPMSDRDKDAEILVLRHQITVLERQLHGDRVRFTPADRAWLAALLHPLPRSVLNYLRLLPDSITEPATLTHLNVRRHDRLSGLLHEYDRAA
jgi:hypothetical protein